MLGAVEVGMLRALFERDVRPDLVLGTSIGAFNGALVAQSARRRRGRAAHRAVAVDEQRPRGGVRRPSAPHRPPGGRLGHPPVVRRAAAAATRGAARRPHLRGAAGDLPGLRGQHRALGRALVHQRPGRGRRGRQRRGPGAAAARRGGRRALPRRRHRQLGPAGPGRRARRHPGLRAAGRPTRPAAHPTEATVGGGAGLVRDRPPAPVRPGAGRAPGLGRVPRPAGPRHVGPRRHACWAAATSPAYRRASTRRTTPPWPTSTSTL